MLKQQINNIYIIPCYRIEAMLQLWINKYEEKKIIATATTSKLKTVNRASQRIQRKIELVEFRTKQLI